MSWYAVRTLYLWGQKSSGINVFEERVVAFEAESETEVFSKASAEADAYAQQADGTAYDIHPQQVSYQLDAGALIDGHEVWSQLFEGYESLDEFYHNRYAQYEYHPAPSELVEGELVEGSQGRRVHPDGV